MTAAVMTEHVDALFMAYKVAAVGVELGHPVSCSTSVRTRLTRPVPRRRHGGFAGT